MLLGPVGKYALVNAKVRARLSALLPPENIARLADARDVPEFYSHLSGTIYEKTLAKPEVSLDPRVAEKLLLEQEVQWHTELIKDLRGPAQKLIELFLEKYEIENLKAALRIRDGNRGLDDLKYIIRKELPHSLPYQSIAEAKSIEDVLAYLIETPYLGPVKSVLDDYKQRGTLFPIEIALEIDFYKRLKARVDALDRADRRIAQRLVGIEIDLKNIGWFVRLKFYYNVPIGDLIEYSIPGGWRMTRERLHQAFEADSMRDVLAVALEKSFRPIADLMRKEEDVSKLYLLEIILWSYMVTEAKKTLGGFPFTIGTVLSYLILKRTEIRNIITILNGKLLHMEKTDIESHLRAAF
jgi:V/A-type H+-transporting ATPase subunit C